MATQGPTVRTVDAAEASQTWGQILDDVAQSHDRVIVARGGTPIAAVISAADLERFRRLEEERDRDFAVVERMRAAFEGVPFEEIEREAAKALAEVRAEMRAERQNTSSASE
jgi:prevent-host-death family protein